VVKPVANVEREVKLAVWPGFELPPIDDVVDGLLAVPAEEQRLDAVYFDAADLRLARADITVRHRSDGGWTVKLPDDAPVSSGALARQEINVAGEPDSPPDLVRSVLAARLRSEPLVAVARLQTLRRRTELVDREGSLVAEIADDEVSVLEGAHLALRFREVEIELAESGSLDVLDQVVARLRAAGAGAPDPTPKVIRALGPRALAAPDLGTPVVGKDPSAAEVLVAGLSRSVRRLIEHDPVLRLDDDDEAVHQARVATRRLRSDLRTYGQLLDPEWTAGLRDGLRWLADALGEVRDADVLTARLRRQLESFRRPDRVVGGALLSLLGEQRSSARQRLLAVLDSPRYFALLDALVDAVREPHLLPPASAPAKEALPRLMRKPWDDLEKSARRLSARSADDELHAVRIRAKRARYAAEVAALVVGAPAQKLADEIGRLQEVLGEHQDACTARDWARRAALDLESPAAFVAGEVSALQDIDAQARRSQWPAAWERASKGKFRSWLKR
jgi:CHAD domain-containing protein